MSSISLRGDGTPGTVQILPEIDWQSPTIESAPPHVYVTRWAGEPAGSPLEVSSDYNDKHFITYTTKRTEELYWVGNKSYTSGIISPGAVFLQGPTTQRRRAIVSSPFDFYRIFFSSEVIAECFEAANGRSANREIQLFDSQFSDDKLVRELTRSIINVGRDRLPLGSLYVESAGLTLAMHLIRSSCGKCSSMGSRYSVSLARWRLNRVLEYIDANMGKKITLAELSGVADLSRMHFAAQFKAATGMSPHAYVTTNRIEHAKRLLRDPDLAITDVAAILGFSSQAHLTSVFRQIVGATPHKWRQSNMRSKRIVV
jgi:AraC-like DNA-binding protein